MAEVRALFQSSVEVNCSVNAVMWNNKSIRTVYQSHDHMYAHTLHHGEHVDKGNTPTYCSVE